MKKIKEIIRDWLIKDELELFQKEIEYFHNHSRNYLDQINEVRSKYVKSLSEINSTKDFVSSCMNVGVDFNIKAGSWAVVAIKNKNGNDHVEFFNLGNLNYLEIREFLKYFNDKSKTVDAPFSGRFFDSRY